MERSESRGVQAARVAVAFLGAAVAAVIGYYLFAIGVFLGSLGGFAGGEFDPTLQNLAVLAAFSIPAVAFVAWTWRRLYRWVRGY